MVRPAQNQIDRLLRSRRKRSERRRWFAALALYTFFIVAAALIQNALALSHEESYLACSIEGVVAHSHDTSCYDTEGNLVCTLPERELHVHDDSCYEEEKDLTCGLAVSDGHVHTDECLGDDGELSCGLEEAEEHHHTDDCYTKTRTLSCGLEAVTEEHVHGPECFQTVSVDDGEPEEAEDALSVANGQSEIITTTQPEIGAQALDDEQNMPDDTEAVPEGQPVLTEDPAPAQSFIGEITDVDGNSWMRVRVKAPQGALPSGAAMSVTYVDGEAVRSSVEAAASAQSGAPVLIQAAKAIDLRFYDQDGNEVKLAGALDVRLTTATVRDMTTPMVAHVPDQAGTNGEAEVLATAALVNEAEDDQTVGTEDTLWFDAAEPGLYMVFDAVPVPDGSGAEEGSKDADGRTLIESVPAEDAAEKDAQDITDKQEKTEDTLVTSYLTASGEAYEVTVTFDEREQLTGNLDLVVREIVEGTDEYEATLASACEVAGLGVDRLSFVRLFDVTILKDGKEIEPKYPAEVRISCVDGVDLSATKDLQAVHLGEDKTEVIKDVDVNDFGTEFTFTQMGFSPTALLGSAAVDPNTSAMIGEDEYPTLSEAVAAAQDGDTIVLIKAADTDNIEINGKSITLDLNGQSSFQNGQYVQSGTLTIASGAALTITNSVDQDIYFSKTVDNYGALTFTGKISFTANINIREGNTQTMLDGSSGSQLKLVTDVIDPLIEIGPNCTPSVYGVSFSNADINAAVNSSDPMDDIAVFHISNANAAGIADRIVFSTTSYNAKASFVYVDASNTIVVHKLTEEDIENAVVQNTNTQQYFTTLQAALAAAKATPTLWILKDIETTGDIVAPPADGACTYVTINMAGHTIKTNGTLRIPVGKTLVVNNSNTTTTNAKFQCNVDNKGTLNLYGYQGRIDIDGSFYLTDNSGGGTPSNTTTLNVSNIISGWFMTDLKAPATLGSYYCRDLPESSVIRVWITDNDELVNKINGPDAMEDVVLFKVDPGTNATAKQNIEKICSRMTIGGWGIVLDAGVALQAKYDADNGTIILHKKTADEAVAMIGETKFNTLESAINAATDGDTIKIVAPYKRVSCGFVYAPVGDNQTVTIDLNGHTVYASADNEYLFFVKGTNHLKLTNSSEEKATISGYYNLANGSKADWENVEVIGSITANGNSEIALRGTDGKEMSVTGPVEVKAASKLFVEGKVTFGEKVSLLGGSTADLNCQTGTLKLETDRTTPDAVATLGADFSVDVIEYTLTNSNDIATLNDPGTSSDYVIFKGGTDDIAGVVQLKNSFTNKLLAVVHTEQTRANDGYIVIRQMNAIYLNGQKGNDSWAGTVTRPVKTFAKALQLYNANPGAYDCIYISGTVVVSGTETWDGGENGVTIYRYPKDSAPSSSGTYPSADYFYPSSSYSNVPYMVVVAGANANLTLKNVTIDGNKSLVTKTQAATMVMANKGGTLNIQSGAVLQNNDISGSEMATVGGALSLSNGSTANMTGGVIRNNQARFGGGVHVSGSTFNMSDGLITGNIASDSRSTQYSCGGGVALQNYQSLSATMNLSGGTISGNEALLWGGGISLGNYYEASVGQQCTLNMTGGAISGNTSGADGGGVFIQHNCVVTISEGIVSGNHSTTRSGLAMFGGGGIYVNGGKSATKPDGELHLNGVVITDNTAAIEGGGIAGCPTSDVKTYLGNGGAIYGNNAPSAKEVFTASGVWGTHSGTANVEISPFMLGGGAYLWKDENNELVNYGTIHGAAAVRLHNDHEDGDADVETAKSLAKVWITGNMSDSRGGGIGSNGKVFIGNVDEPVTTVTARKEWAEGTAPAASVRLVLERKVGESDWEPIAYQVLPAGRPSSWTFTFVNLPAVYEYRVSEDMDYVVNGVKTGDAYDVTVEFIDGVWVITNTEKPPTSVNVLLGKVDQNGALLGGSIFSLQMYDGSSWVNVPDKSELKPGDTEASNPLAIGEYEVGWYRLTEAVAPDGYVILTAPVHFEVYEDSANRTVKARFTDAEGQALIRDDQEVTDTGVAKIVGTTIEDVITYTITVKNMPGTPLPATGGTGTASFTLTGLMLLALSAVLATRRHREDAASL